MFFCRYNIIKRKHEFTIIQRKNIYQSVKVCRTQNFCICIDVNTKYAGKECDKLYEVLSTLKNKKLKINNILVEKYKDMLEYANFEPDYYSRTSTGIYKSGHNSIRLLKWLACYDRSYYGIYFL